MSVRLLRTELRRFFARRAIILSLLGSMLLALGLNAVQLARSHDNASYVRQDVSTALVQECSSGSYAGLPVVAQGCIPVNFAPDTSDVPQPFTPAYAATGRDERIDVAQTFASTVRGVGLTLTLLAAFLAATFIAADFGTSIATQLLFEPRRRRVYLTKTVAAAIGCGAVAAIVLVWCGLLQYGGASLRGITTGVDGTWVLHRLGDIGRAAAASALMGVVSFAIAAATRKTAASVGTLFGLFVAMEFLRGPHWAHVIGRLIPVNAFWGIATGFAGELPDFLVDLHTMAGALLIGIAWAVAVTIVGAELFARREVR